MAKGENFMLILPDRETFQEQYKLYATKKLHLIKEKYGNLGRDIALKLPHGLSMMRANEKVARESSFFNESYFLSSALEGCFHDIGRFEQYRITGSLTDSVLYATTGIGDHGNLGRKLLLANGKSLLRQIIPEESSYDSIFTEVVGEHTTIRNKNYQLPIGSLTKRFQDYSLEEVAKSKNSSLKNELIALKILLLQETDCLELLQNIMDENWIPGIYAEQDQFVNDEIWDDFIHFRYIDMRKYRQEGKWTANAGFLLRYGLLTRQMQLVATLKGFEAMDGFQKVWEQTVKHMVPSESGFQIDPRLQDAQDFIEMAVHNLIETSPDGFLITEESREKAKQLSINNWKRRA